MTDSSIQQPDAELPPHAQNGAGEPRIGELPADETADVEARARRMGWVPKDQFRGDPEKWMPAERFVEYSERSFPIMRERYNALDAKFANLERRFDQTSARLEETTRVLSEFREFASRGEQRAYERAKRELEKQMSAAVATGDTVAYQEAKQELDQLQPPKPAGSPAPPTAPQVDPATAAEMAAWIRQNPWFSTDPELNQAAVTLYGTLEQTKPHLSVQDKLKEVKRAVMVLHPDRFETPRPAASPVSAPTPRVPSSKKKTIKDLPKEAQEAFVRFQKQMPGYTEEEYLNVYLAGDE